MIDLNRLRDDFEKTKNLILKKEPSFDVDGLFALDKQERALRVNIEDLRKKRNDLSSKGAGGVTGEIREQSIAIGKELKTKEKDLADVVAALKTLALSCPNIPQDMVPEGNKEANTVVRTVGSKQVFSFKYKNHVELNEALKWFDFDAAAAMSGSNFVFYRGDAVKMMYALTRLMLKNNVKHGFEPVVPPYLVTKKALENSGNLPKFQGDFYEMEADGLCLIPTAEVSLTNLYENKILAGSSLPLRHTAWTGCFRREAGGYGSAERGLIRIHQFEKVELYSVCAPENSDAELDYMLSCAENFLQQLGLHYQVSLLAAQDCSFASTKTYDIEVWLPGQNCFKEVSSCSNCTDFQARRAKIRYKKNEGDKPQLVHTLNASSLALPRLMVALMEQYQQEDGSITFPKVLQDAMDIVW